MLASVISFTVCYFLGVFFWWILRIYFKKQGVKISAYYAFAASVFSVIVITILVRLINIGSEGCVISGIVVMGLLSLDIKQGADTRSRNKILIYMFIGSILSGVINYLISRIN